MKTFTHDGCPRRALRLPGGDFPALRCCGGGGGGQASTATAQNTTSNAPVTSGSSSPINSSGGSQVNASGSVTMNSTTDPAAFATIAQIVGNSLNNTAQTQQAIVAQQNSSNDAVNAILGKVTAADQSIAANTASGGATATNSSVLKIAGLALAGLLGFGWFLSRKEK